MRFLPSAHFITVHAPFPLLTEYDSHQEYPPKKQKYPPEKQNNSGGLFLCCQSFNNF